MEGTCDYANQIERHRSVSLMGPFSEQKQFERAAAIKRLLDNNPQIDDLYRGMWENKLRGLAKNETEYNYRVKTIYSQMKRGPVIQYEGGKYV